MKKITKLIKNYYPTKYQALLFLIIPVLIGMLNSLLFDNDIWFLINTGRHILTNGFPVIEPFTIHENLSFVVQQWGSDIIFYTTYKYLGSIGLYLLTNLVNIYIIFITYKLSMVLANKKRNLAVLFTCIITTLLALFFIITRPQILSISIFLTAFYFLEKFEQTNNKKFLLIIPVLSVLLINIHASMWWMLIIFMIPYLLHNIPFKTKLLDNSKNTKYKEILVIIFISIMVGLINPYGLKAITYLFTSYNNYYINTLVNEMQIPSIHNLSGKVVYLIIFTVYLILIFTKKKIKTNHLFLLLGTTYLALSSFKGLSNFLICAWFPLIDTLKDKFHLIKEPKKQSKKPYILISIIFITFLSLLIFNFRAIDMQQSTKKGVDYLTTNYDVKDIRLYTDYNDGNYPEYKGIKVYLDTRAEVFLKANNNKSDILKEYYDLQAGRLDITNFLNKYKFTHLLVRENDYLYKYLEASDEYKVIFKDREHGENIQIVNKNNKLYKIFEKTS